MKRVLLPTIRYLQIAITCLYSSPERAPLLYFASSQLGALRDLGGAGPQC